VALKAYYNHASHSAWHYLAKPNPWLHPQASFVYVDKGHRLSCWSVFETCESLIALFWFAVTDNKVLSPTSSVVEGRIAHFIEKLRLIGRAHNWDETREVDGLLEEFNDLEGDRPSCYSETKRRLFQAVINHPLFTMITLETIKQTLRDLVLTHFKQILTTAPNSEVISEAFNTYFTTLDKDSIKPLSVLNLMPSQQAAMIAALSAQYGEAFTGDPSLMQWVHETLTLRLNSTIVSDHYHALKLDGLTQLSIFLRQKAMQPCLPKFDISAQNPASILTLSSGSGSHIEALADKATLVSEVNMAEQINISTATLAFKKDISITSEKDKTVLAQSQQTTNLPSIFSQSKKRKHQNEEENETGVSPKKR
jgi:hypothetical protein